VEPVLERYTRHQVLRTPDHALAHPEDDVAQVRRWFQRLQLHVRSVDYVGARSLFAENMITFGTFRAFTVGRDATEKEQWRNVWSRIDGFRWLLDDLRIIISGDRLTAVGMAVFESVGYTEDGMPYERPGRATAVLGRSALAGDWVAQHMHVSLFRDVPTRSFGTKPENTTPAI
jgi:ketosteroid isomerase-like protein